MIIKFEEYYLEELYTTGNTKNRKIRFPKVLIKKYIKTITTLRGVERVEDLFKFNALNYKRLDGNKKELESVRVDHKYRLEFRTTIEGEEPDCITICNIIKLSNHYQ
jgi:proteic killer suppression protein